ncbi:cell division protein FtsZ [Niastella vici]|uniref:Cell division protein FtsZ n=1 Tax=Niastella vici TaxID=1703345 RepID=A0A1V9FSR9_9BACT|nr:cell division protein FtsZ [Niastella vici]OQP61384.1 cell division protein FtsZ [Niastella vici]
MIHFDLPKEKSSILKVIGVGGGGSNAVNHMYSQNIEGVNFIICNTDAQAISKSQVPNKVQLGPHLTQGLGAGANPEIGRQATEESLEELRRILEVNTKMAFITAGMGGGTGTGGAPIIARICKELGILTVGIVTTPFSYEGPKRQAQAENGIKQLKQSVDTLLVISNDKLRHQFGNLKMKEAFSKADNVLSTAAKCITDVINSTGQINVDFADVCTIMRNGGVAILGSAATRGEDRAIRCIEEALNSPLLNDNDIRGAKWILININSSEGDHEFTMDEVEIIQNYLLSQAGDDTDVILGMGYDNSLNDKIGITLIATGFEHKDPFKKAAAKTPEPKKDEKIILSLNQQAEKPKKEQPVAEKKEEKAAEPVIKPELAPKLIDTDTSSASIALELFTNEETGKTTVDNGVDKNGAPEKIEWVLSQPSDPVEKYTGSTVNQQQQQQPQKTQNNSSTSAASGGYLAKPSNIYAEPKPIESKPEQQHSPVNEPVRNAGAKPVQEEDPSNDLHLVFKDDIPAADAPGAYHAQPPVSSGNISAEDLAMLDEAEEQKRRAAERIQKLRNLSFNINGADPNNEFETVPAYIRRNLELYNTISSVENFYSKYEVKADENNNGQISTLNTFLDGKKPD